ncbi:MAG: hypothetical protein ACRDJE_01065 [Dehalococcoidia bacterium]
MTASPYLYYDQVFVILRVDTSADQERAPGAGVALLKALWSEAAAEAEVERLLLDGDAAGTSTRPGEHPMNDTSLRLQAPMSPLRQPSAARLAA